jgi:hypothetical protein
MFEGIDLTAEDAERRRGKTAKEFATEITENTEFENRRRAIPSSPLRDLCALCG